MQILDGFRATIGQGANPKMAVRKSGWATGQCASAKPFSHRKTHPVWGVKVNGGDEGNRTPVRKRIRKVFSERSCLLRFPTEAGRQPSYLCRYRQNTISYRTKDKKSLTTKMMPYPNPWYSQVGQLPLIRQRMLNYC